MKPKTDLPPADVLSPDEEGILAVLREILAGLRDRGVAVNLDSFRAAVIAAGAVRTTGTDGDPHSGYALGGVRFMAWETKGRPGTITVAFPREAP